MKKRIVTFLLCTTILTASVIPVFAAPDTEEVVETNAEAEPLEETAEIEEPETTADTDDSADQDENTEDGDELDVITRTEKNETNNCQISISATMPDGFNLDFYIEFQNKSSNQVYRMIAYHNNDYVAHMFIPEGNYYVNTCAVWDDNTSKYPMVLPEDFTATKNGNVVLETTLVNFDDVEEQANKRLYPGAESKLTEKDMTSKIKPWQHVTHNGTGSENVYRSGVSRIPMDIMVKIVKSGKVNEAEIQVSIDGGNTFGEKQLLPSSLPIINGADETGITIKFDTSDEFVADDTYSIHTYHEFNVNGSCNGTGDMNAYESGIIPQNLSLYLVIKESGQIGEAQFTYSVSGKSGPFNENIMTIPEDGIVNLSKIGTTLQFTEGTYKVGDTFEVSLEATKVRKNYIIPITIVIVIILAAIIIAYFVLLSFKEPNANYHLQSYQPVTLPEKKKKSRKKK